MGKPNPNQGPLTLEEYLAFDNESPRRHEFVAGRVYSMAGTTARHNAIASNVHALLRTAAHGGPCRAYLLEVKVRAAHDRVYYPDGVVVCTPHGGDTRMFESPCLVVEVTSRTSRRLDRGEKLDVYLTIPSLRGYLIVEHDRRHATLFTRGANDIWQRDEVVGSGLLSIPCPELAVPLDAVYQGVDLPLHVREDDDDLDDWVDDEWSDLVEVSAN